MKWLFLMFLIDLSTGTPRPKMQATQAFASEEACHALGREIAKSFGYDDEQLSSFSTCIPESLFRAQGLQTERFDG